MNEKGIIKIGASTILLVIAIFIIICMAYYIYIDKANTKTEMAAVQTNTVEMEETINDLQTKLNTISDVINSDKTDSNEADDLTSTNESENKFSDEEMKTALQNYLDLVGAKQGSPIGMIEKLGIYKEDYKNVIRTSDNYIKTDVPYSTYKEKVLEYVTEDWFEKFNSYGDSACCKEIDGLLYYYDVGATGISYEVDHVALKGDYSDFVYVARVYNISLDDSKELENVEFHVADNNGKCVISYCDYK